MVTANATLSRDCPAMKECACEVETGGDLERKDVRHELAIIRCDSISLPGRPSSNEPLPQSVDFQRDWFLNFRIAVNYSESQSPQPNPANNYSLLREAVRAYLAIGYVDIGVVVEETDPVMLYPGSNLLSFVNVNVRQRLKGATLANLGFETLEAYPIVEVKQTIPNPAATTDPNISTLSFSLLSKTGSWTIVQEYRANSVLSALSSIGGLGSLLSTLLVVLLGTSLLGALFRMKPYSPFGLLHKVGPLQRGMVQKCDELYPGLRRDLHRLGVEPGVVAYILDTYIDIEALGCDIHGDKAPCPMPEPSALVPDNPQAYVEERPHASSQDREEVELSLPDDVEAQRSVHGGPDGTVRGTRRTCDIDESVRT